MAVEQSVKEEISKSAEELISKELLDMGFMAHWSGYIYLREAIKTVAVDERYLFGITKNLYPRIAKAYGTSSCAVERGIRKAIERADKAFIFCGDRAEAHFTNKEFIAAVAAKIRRMY